MDRQYLRWEVKNPRMRMNGGVRTSVHLMTQQIPASGRHVLVGVYALHGCSQSVTDNVYFFPIGILGQLDSAGNWRRIHGLCNIFFPENKFLRGHYLNTCPSYQRTDIYPGRSRRE